MGNRVIVHLIRHEKTDGNMKRKYVGWTDESIISKEQHFNIPIQANEVYGSDLRRCKETAHLYFPNANYYSDKNLREIHFGDFEMKTYEQLKDNPIYQKWIEDPVSVTPPNGEHYLDFNKRILQGFQQIVSKNGQYTFIVHGGVIRAILSLFSPKMESFQQIAVSHRTIYSLSWVHIKDVEEGRRCESLSVVPIMEKENLSSKS
ncbi:histidine phosphatase family protein [Ureibacillus sp. Re31]|uniref:Histidine phosphatase family protein n=1 Tax=Ureibacillus galli TaxID=2762222 RepID=A0ABR8XES9_9BACL|nr:histidine phosphatase family protein [Ureibacillus galli]MBD8027718.1 histidine phosphatase family protein [Ureibacillus galli]